MLKTWIDEKKNIQVVQRSFVGGDEPSAVVEVEVAEDSTGLLTVFVRQLCDDLPLVTVKFVGPEAR